MSLFNHLIDVHQGHGEIYKECPHGNIVRDWLKKGKVNFKFFVQSINMA